MAATGGIEDRIGFLLRLAQEASFSAFARRTGEAALRPGRYAILSLVGAHPGISQTALGLAAGRDKSTLTPALADMERRGLLKRERLAQDGRRYALRLTPAGRAMLKRLAAHAAAHDAELDALVGAEAHGAVVAALRRIASGWRDEA